MVEILFNLTIVYLTKLFLDKRKLIMRNRTNLELKKIKNDNSKTTLLAIHFVQSDSINFKELFRKNPSINKLNLSSIEVHKENLLNLSNLLAASTYNITSLNFFGSKIGISGAKLLSNGLKNNYTLKSLNLSCNEIQDEGLGYLVKALKGKTTFKEFSSLFKNGITNDGVIHIAELLENSNITKVELKYNDIGKDGIKTLTPYIQNSKYLTHLSLYSKKIIEEGGNDLENIRSLVEDAIKILQCNKSLTFFHIIPYLLIKDLPQEFNKILTNIYRHKYVEGVVVLPESYYSSDNKLMTLKSVYKNNQDNVKTIQNIIKKAINYVKNNEGNLSQEELSILTVKDKDFVKAQVNANPEWFENEGREPLEVEEFLHEIEHISFAGMIDAPVE
jgi:hypothetical protein